jgi:ferredoxin
MSAETPTITYGKITIPIEVDRDLLSQLLDAGAEIAYICMAGSCGTCRVQVHSGAEHLEEMNAAELSRLKIRDGSMRLACQTMCTGTGDVVVSQPALR